MASSDIDTRAHDQELAGLDLLELAGADIESRGRRVWRAAWPKLAALVLGIGIWQVVVWSGWRPDYVLAPPRDAWDDLWGYGTDGTLTTALGITMRRAALGFALAVVIGTIVGSLVARIRPLRAAFGSLITGLQTMPSIAWFPLAILIFQLSERAIMFVVVLGAAPSIANGLIAGTDTIPPILLRAGRVLGARGLAAYRYVILPASLPSFVAGLKQGWAFAWRSLMAGELLVVIRGKESVGFLLEQNREVINSSALLATMIVILVIGIVVDSVLFSTLERAIRRRWGLLEPAR
ncbi:MAG TPA: ABC transporter permease [Acidimicrobiales bacterium]|jgi:NitT/TauT family transport system permease protein|nr:ABC transporter permease [Acidimicrobiales bacterium]